MRAGANNFPDAPSLLSSYEHIRKRTIPPIWNFSGLIVIGIAIVALAISERYRHEQVNNFVHSPRKDDVLEIVLAYDKYTLYKIEKVEKDTAYYFANKYETTDPSGLADLKNKGEDGFETSTTYGIPIKRLIKMNEDNKILDIDRNKN
ncbi:MAG: hypothetical protein ABJA76_05690 [Mucilaginibacter sp.]